MRLRATRLSAISNAMRSAFKIASANPVLWWDAESHRAGMAGGAASLFQDAAGTSAVSAVEQPVGRAVDQSGNARHALQATSTARPLLTARKNLLTYSEQFDNAVWSKVNGPVVLSNVATAPDGATSADSVQATTGGDYRYISSPFFNVGQNATVTASIYVKKETSETVLGGIGVDFQGGARRLVYVGFNAVTGVAVNLPGGNLTPVLSVIDAGDYWRLIVTVTDTGSNPDVLMQYYANLSLDNTSVNGWVAASSPKVIWGAQIEIGPTATSYQRIGAKKNLLTFTEQLDNSAWGKANGVVVTADTHLSPIGTLSADTITDPSTAFSGVDGPIFTAAANTTYAFSVWVRKTTGATTHPGFALGFFGGTAKYASCSMNTNTGACAMRTGESAGSVSAVSDGDYWRLTLSSASTATTTSARVQVYPSVNSDGGSTWSAAQSGSIVMWGAQIETGAAATSYERIESAASAYDITAAPLMLRFDGVDDGLASATFAAGTLPGNADAYLVIWPDADEQETVLVDDPSVWGTRYFGVRHPTANIPQSADGPTTSNAQFTVNGSQIAGTTNPTRVQLFEATRTGVPVLLQIAGLNLSEWTQVALGRYVGNSSGFGYKGRHGCLLITPAQSDSTRAKIRKALAKAYQITGVV